MFPLTRIKAAKTAAAILLAAVSAAAQAAPTLYINGGQLTLQSNGVAVAGLQFTVPSTTGLVLNTALAPNKTLNCGATICIIIGNNQLAIPDGPLVNLTALPTAIIGAAPAGTSVTVNTTTNPCDINKDGKIDINDFAAIVQLADGVTTGTADINGDGKTDIFDIFRVILAIANGGSCKVGP